MGYREGMYTSIVDKGVEAPWTGLDLLKSLLDRLIAGEIDLDCFDGIARLWTFLVEGLDRKLALLWRTTAENDVMGLVRLQKRLDGLVADATVTASDENNP